MGSTEIGQYDRNFRYDDLMESQSTGEALAYVIPIALLLGAYLFFAGKNTFGGIRILLKGPGSLRRMPGKGQGRINNL